MTDNTDDSSPLIRVVHVSRNYGAHSVQAVRDVSMTVARGEFIALMGPSGCGKSTLLNLLGAMDQASEGEIWLDGTNLVQLGEGQLTELRRDRIGFVFQFFNLLSTLTVFENVALPLQLSRRFSAKELRKKVDAILKTVDLSDRAEFYPARLSGGEMQRVAIARALIHEPEIILADEPTGNLDSENGKIVLEMLRRISQEEGRTIVMATHSEEAAQVATRILRMRDGRILEPARR